MSFDLQYDATVASWERPYVGQDHRILVDSVRKAKRDANSARYCNILPIIQSSGMGKSRLAHEAGNVVVTLPLNIRFRAYDIAWPPPDHKARDFLEVVAGLEEARARHLAFFIAMFQCASSRIKSFSDKVYEDEESLAKDWKAYLDADDRHARRQYFDDVVKEARETMEVIQIGSSAERRARPAQLLRELKAKAPEQSRDLVRAIESRLKGGFKHPEVAVLVYVDEVSEISKKFIGGSVSLYDTLLEAFTDLGPDNPLFLLPIATDPAIIRRDGSPIRHQPPYSELPFDILPEGRPLFYPGTMTMRDVSQPNYMCKFGRPMFWTRQEYMRTHGAVTRDFATQKLLCYGAIRDLLRPKSEGGVSCSPEMIFAVLSTRLSLEFDTSTEEARRLTENMIYRHMRIAFSFPAHGGHVWSGAPSEPLLAEAAAEFMYKCHNVDWTGELADAVDRGIVKHSWRGDLLMRLLLTLAFDRAGDEGRANNAFCEYDLYSAPVPVVDFLRALFADRWHDVVETALPFTAGGQGEAGAVPLREAFKGAFVRFSHFIEFDGDDFADTHVALAAVARGFAIRLVPAHGTVDLAIPVVMRDEKLTTEVISFIFIKLKTKHERVGRPDREYVENAFPSDTSGKHPFIHIVMQLHPDASPPTDDPGTDPDQVSEAHPCYRLTAYGCSPTVYKAVNDQNREHFATLAQPSNIVKPSPEYTPQRIFYQQRLKHEWDRSPASLDWMGGDAEEPEVDGTVEGVFAV